MFKGKVIGYKSIVSKNMSNNYNNKNSAVVIEGYWERDRQWKLRVIEILKRNKLAKPAELELLMNFVR